MIYIRILFCFILISILIVSNQLYSQNLIIDGSLENAEVKLAEEGVFSIWKAEKDADVQSHSHVDYFHRDCKITHNCIMNCKDCHIYNNKFGSACPRTGNGFAGFFPLKEFIIFKLSEPLEKNKRYCLQYFTSKPDKVKDVTFGYITNSKLSYIEALFTNKFPRLNLEAKKFFCSKCNSNHSHKETIMLHGKLAKMKNTIVEDTLWNLNGGVYKAKGGEHFMTLGNFRLEKGEEMLKYRVETEYQYKGKTYTRYKWTKKFYYFIDDVSLFEVNSESNCNYQKDELSKQIYINRMKNECIELDNRVSLDTANIKYFKNGEIYILERIEFESDQSTLLKESQTELDRLRHQILELNNINIKIIGHTDGQSTEKYNMQLSIQRAQNVFDYLVNKGIDNKILDFEGKGETEPYRSNRTEGGRSLNRRVEIIVYK